MSKTFERFLRSFTDEELTAFAQERSQVQPPYWSVMRLALRVEADRRGLLHGEELDEIISSMPSTPRAHAGTA